ncbi:MAG: glycoside hydrolase family 92 protein [Flavobacteriaceae bacterium]|nr:glycoside hydrolase family 92 protein [Flavobacteriaceae bacterium]
MKKYIWLLPLFILSGCTLGNPPSIKSDFDPLKYVDPFVGTGGHGHTFPGATTPFGMVQLSPDTRLEGWDGCSGYHYSDNYIYGFSHTHLSGTGVSDYGDILLMPAGAKNWHNGAESKDGYRQYFNHKNEVASPGFYQVYLDSLDLVASMTASPRTGIHQYQYSRQHPQYLAIDLAHRDEVLSADLELVDAYTLRGHRHSKEWAEDQRLYFYIKLSHPIKSVLHEEGESIENAYDFEYRKNLQMAYLKFDNPENSPVEIKVGISAVDQEGAFQNYMAEAAGKSFDQMRFEAEKLWRDQLLKIKVAAKEQGDLINFYSSLYHSMIAPNLYQDVDGRYRGMDLEIHQDTTFNYYTVFSLWDTFRAAHPLYTIIEPERSVDFVKTLLAKYDEGGIMPIWDLASNYTGCMIGYHGVSVIADAYLKGLDGFDAQKALQAMKHSALQDHLGLKPYKELSFIPLEIESESVSKTLEYAYDDWTIAQMAKALGQNEDYNAFIKRAQNYKSVFDPQTGFMRARHYNGWFSPFDPYEVNFNYTEANAWQYRFFVPHDVEGLIELMGGPNNFERELDKLFSTGSATTGRDQADITGLIGQYAHGNEPSHHMAYLYHYVQKPYKSQERIRQILTQLYSPTPDGISGNEDCGQMSAWYILSSLGLYPMTPGNPEYLLGSPLVDRAEIQVGDQTFSVLAHNNERDHPYVQSVKLNGALWDKSYLPHSALTQGGVLEFFMGAEPSDWGASKEQSPHSKIEIAQSEALIVPPFIKSGTTAIKGSTTVVLDQVNDSAQIFYRLNDEPSKQYENPIVLQDDAVLSVYAQDSQGKRSSKVTTKFLKIDPLRTITPKTPFANQYSAGGPYALIDGYFGSNDFRTGTWQGYEGVDIDVIVDLGRVQTVNEVSINFLEDQRSWIFLPTEVELAVGLDEQTKTIDKIELPEITPRKESMQKTITFSLDGSLQRYIHLKAKNYGTLPPWHLGYGGEAWLFADEITIK